MLASYHVHRSSQGFRIATATLPESECLALSIHIPAGGRDDPPGKAGLAHFVEHMIFKGTGKRDARRISFETEDLGASLNAFTSEDQTVYEARGDAASLVPIADILADIVWHSTFPEDEVRLEHGVIAEEIVMYHENPSDHIGDLMSASLWSPHPLGDPISGTLESIDRIRRDDLVGFSQAHHRDPGLVIAVAGPHRADEVIAVLEPLLPGSGNSVSGHPYSDPLDGPRQRREPRETAQVQLALGFRCFGRRDPRRHALRLLSTILGEGASSRLFQSLREERGLCYHIASDVVLLDDTGALEIHAGLDPGSRDEALESIRRELRQLSDTGPSEEELRRAKRLHASQMKAALETTAAHASWAGESLLHHDEIREPAEVLTEIEAVQAGELREVAAEFLVESREALAEIHPA
ncbi:M16 family metallopeptidase [Haloferula sp. A504]|uniref:M16 family metallopeptidase n=1 Tax=Haloferula sp. A504 TaxID=3373601 RepID=UPI0031C3CEE5|nr:insulinase family protein [Verrucomicrobiaceae bacterium E54]